MTLVTYDLIVNDKAFRSFVYHRIAKEIGKPQYCFPSTFPLLYRYRSLSEYAVSDIINDRITLSAIGGFNDLYDGTIPLHGTAEQRKSEVQKSLNELFGPEDSIGESCIDLYNEYKKSIEKSVTRDSRARFRFVDYMGMYVCCFSESCDSTLIWAHYADNNKGICIEYDFNQLPCQHSYRNMIFPVAYSVSPVMVNDLLSQEKNKEYKYSIDAGILCASLNKSSIWEYEREWRILFGSLSDKNKAQRFEIKALVKPISICFGFHFMKSFFHYGGKDRDSEIKLYKSLMELFDYMKRNTITAKVMMPQVGSFILIPIVVRIDDLIYIVSEYCQAGKPKEMRFYHLAQDRLLDILEENTHA